MLCPIDCRSLAAINLHRLLGGVVFSELKWRSGEWNINEHLAHGTIFPLWAVNVIGLGGKGCEVGWEAPM